MEEREKVLSDMRVGGSVLAGLAVLILGITFAGGDKGLVFRPVARVRALLYDVGGLKKGSSVTMGGMVIGKVSAIGFSFQPEGTMIEVLMEVRSEVRSQIKSDSVPAVRTQGMLGDRYVEISVGGKDSAPLPEGRPLRGQSAAEFDETLKEAKNALSETTKMLEAINDKEGSVGRFVHDDRFYEQLVAVTRELNDLIRDFKKQPRKYIKFSLF